MLALLKSALLQGCCERVCLDFCTARSAAAIASNGAATECTDEAQLAELLNSETSLTAETSFLNSETERKGAPASHGTASQLLQSAGASQRCVVVIFVSINWKASRHNSEDSVLRNITLLRPTVRSIVRLTAPLLFASVRWVNATVLSNYPRCPY